MTGKSNGAPSSADLSEAGGRGAPVEALRKLLLSAPSSFLEGAADNPAMTESEMILLLRNRQATPKVLLSIGRDRRWTRSQEVKKLLLLHPRLPLVAARNLLPHLFWRQLSEVARSPHVNPVIKRRAELSLKAKIDELSLGEKVALAREATTFVIGFLIEQSEAPVLRAMLGNGRLRELDAASIAADDSLPGDLLAFLAGHHRWGALRSVRLALLGNPRTPVAAALRLLGRLALRDLRRLAKDDNVPKIVSVGAERRLQKHEPRLERGD